MGARAPDLAAYMAVSIEVSTPILLVLGLLTRAASLVLLGMTTVIEVFVCPGLADAHSMGGDDVGSVQPPAADGRRLWGGKGS